MFAKYHHCFEKKISGVRLRMKLSLAPVVVLCEWTPNQEQLLYLPKNLKKMQTLGPRQSH